ncbi:unnamed protein product [Euphydryas editha]|uniref:Uncharacterized protein n=1 Tax=Euphydryas editha TaxID=104508 RepID=A0AAU9U1W4_EUPED|nr:unnamed protein product [Euphydryas editha]
MAGKASFLLVIFAILFVAQNILCEELKTNVDLSSDFLPMMVAESSLMRSGARRKLCNPRQCNVKCRGSRYWMGICVTPIHCICI